MQQLKEAHGPALVLKQLRFLRIQLAGPTETQKLGDEIRGHAERLRAALDAWDEADLLAQAATQKIEYFEETLEGRLSGLELSALGLVGRDKSDARYQRLFGDRSLSELKRLPYDEEALAVEGLLQRLAEPGFEALQAPASQVREALDAFTAETRRRDQLRLDAAALDNTVQTITAGARKAYNLMELELLQIFGNQRSLVDSFFRRMVESRKKKAAEPEES